MLFLPVLSTLTSHAGRPPSASSAGVSDLSLVYAAGVEVSSVSVPPRDSLAGITHSSDVFHFKMLAIY